MREATQQEIEAGEIVKTAQDAVDKAENRMSYNTTLITDMRARKEKLNTEGEMLKAKDELSVDLRHRLLDIETDTATIDRNIKNLSSEHQGLQHSIDMAGVGLQSARQNYADVTAPPSVTGQLSQQDVLTLQSSTPKSKLDFAGKKQLIDRYGMEAYNEHVPMI